MSKSIIFTILFLIIVSIVGYFGYDVYTQVYLAPRDLKAGNYSIEILPGEGISQIASKLEKKGVVRSRFGLILANQLGKRYTFLAGEYNLNIKKGDTPQIILQKMSEISQQIAATSNKNNLRKTVTLTFKEGNTLDKIAFLLEKEGVISYEDFTNFSKNPDNFDRKTYPFLPEPLDCEYGDIKTCAKYYPEGYLYPDTYEFFVNSTPTEVYAKFFDNFRKKVWNVLSEEDKNSDLNFQDAIILASVLEKETGRPAKGVNDANKDEVNQERRNMAQVFRNRTAIKMKWRSDVTAEYGQFEIKEEADGTKTFVAKKLCQQTFTIENCLFLDNPDIQNKYNTYFVDTAPIGPVTSPQFDNIFASLNPTPNKYLFFVSDITGKKYFSQTEAQFNQSIRDVQAINRNLEKSQN